MRFLTAVILLASCVVVRGNWVLYNGTHLFNGTHFYNGSLVSSAVVPTNRPQYPGPVYHPRNESFTLGTRDPNPGGNHLVLGQAGPYDGILFRGKFFYPGLLFVKRQKTLDLPQKGGIAYISAIRVWDMSLPGSGGTASILEGGVGFRSVSISLVSKRSKSMNFLVEIYGRY